MFQKQTDTEELSVLNVRLSLKGDKTIIFGLYLQFLEVIRENEYITFSSIDFNNPKDTQ